MRSMQAMRELKWISDRYFCADDADVFNNFANTLGSLGFHNGMKFVLEEYEGVEEGCKCGHCTTYHRYTEVYTWDAENDGYLEWSSDY